jgi:V-type H+-transporting ATPase subunit a
MINYDVADFKDISIYTVYRSFVMMQKTIAGVTNKFRLRDQLMAGLVWVPAKHSEEFIAKKDDMNLKMNANLMVRQRVIDEELITPTCFTENEFSGPFQMIVDTYGVPNYKETNPAVFTCVTFPFLFGVMFGDVFAGTLLTCFALAIFMFGGGKSSILNGAHYFRWLVLLMGLFSLYSGLLYNDFTSLPLYLFGDSCYKYLPDNDTPTRISDQCVYPFGVDPAWYLSRDELTFQNSMKMKIAVILGVFQMCIGIIIKGCNAKYNKNKLDFWFEFVPQLSMMLALFGFMDYMIISKWLINWDGKTD